MNSSLAYCLFLCILSMFQLPARGACKQESLVNCLQHLGGRSCFERFACDVSCQRPQLQECLRFNGGDACYEKWFCEKQNDLGSRFGDFYLDNYPYISTEVRKFHRGSFGCAAFASTALKLAGYDISQVKVTNDLERQLINLGWTKITNLRALKKGDVVFTTKSR